MAKKTRTRLPLAQKQKLLREADKVGDTAVIKKYKVSQASLWRWRKTGVAAESTAEVATKKTRNAAAAKKVRAIAQEIEQTAQAQKPSLLALMELIERQKLSAKDAYTVAESFQVAASA